GNVVPDAEDGAGQGGDRIEVGGGQGDGQTGILHSHLHRDGPAARLVLPEKAGGEIPQGQPGQVVQHHRHEDDRGGQQLIGPVCDDAGDDGDDGEDGDGRQGGRRLLHGDREKAFDQDSQDDGHDHHLHDGLEQGPGFDGQPPIGQKQHQQRSENGSKQRGDGRNDDRKGHVPPGQVDDDVGGGSAGACSHQNHSRGQIRGQPEQQGDQEGRSGHDDVLGGDADQNRNGLLQDEAEIIRRKGGSHAEHDDAQ